MSICRICLEEETLNNPIIRRCDCKGCSIHDSCLEKWILKKGNNYCEICKKEFKGVNITYDYKDNNDIWKTIYPTFNSLLVILSTLNICFLMEKYKKNNEKIVGALNVSFLLYFINLSNSNEYKKKLMNIKEISFNKINENNIV